MFKRSWITRLFGRAARTFRSGRWHGRHRPLRGGRRLGLELLEGRLAPATLTVNSLADTANPTDPYLSLREAIALVNSPTLPSGLSNQILGQISGTLHQGGSDTVVFDPTAVRTSITLTGGQLELSLPSSTAQVTIDGGGSAGVTLNGNRASRVLVVDSGVRATADHLTLTNGQTQSGGGIANMGTLTVSNSTVSGNSAGIYGGGVYNTGTLTVSNSTVSGNSAGAQQPSQGGEGAGIYNSGTLTVSGSVVRSNTCNGAYGGGIANWGGTLTVTGSTVTGNSAENLVHRVGYGGGIFNNGTVSVTASTITSNFAFGSGGGIDSQQGSVTVTASTIASNHALLNGGISNSGTLTLTNSTIESNRADGTGSEGFYGQGGGIGNFTSGTLTVAGCTLHGNSSGYAGGGIGNAGTLTLTDSAVTDNHATVTRTGTMIPSPYARGGGIYTTGSLTLVRCTVSGNSATLTAGNIAYGNANGGGLYSNGCTVTLTDSTVSGNSSAGTFTGGDGLVSAYGGGLTGDFSTLTLTRCTFSGNTVTGGNADGYGGGLHGYMTTATLTDCTVANNADGSTSGVNVGGGGVSDLGGSFTLASCTVTGNTVTTAGATGHGGGLFFDGSAGAFQLGNTVVAGDAADGYGPDAAGSFSSAGYNLVGDADGSDGWAGADLTGTGSAPLDPMLGALGSYGGPTQTVPLRAGSPCLDAGDPGQLGSADQRGVARTGGVNIGAFQASAAVLVLTAPETAIPGDPFDLTVAVYDAFGQLAVGYTGTVTISTTDPDPGVVLPADYTFTPADGGSHTFSAGCTLITPGEQTLTVTDRDAGFSASLTLSVSP
jgi:hypothetical protein